MKKLRNWITNHGNVKDFLLGTGLSRSYFSEWECGKKRISLQIASRIVNYTKSSITYDDLVDFENSFK